MNEPLLVEHPARRFVGLATPFIHGRSPETNAPQIIGPLWEKYGQFIEILDALPDRVDPAACYGVIWGEPEAQRSHKHELMYMAGVEVNADRPIGDLPEGLTSRDLPACTLAVFEHHGPITEIRRTLDAIYDGWLHEDKYEHAEVVDLERYDERFDPCGDASVFDYAISVRLKDESAAVASK